MKRLLYIFILALACGCASNSNQKISSPLIGWVQNEYIIVNVNLDGSNVPEYMTNAFKRLSFAASMTNSASNADSSASRRFMSLGRGNEIIAVDNQLLVGHDIGNATSNEVNASASIPLNL